VAALTGRRRLQWSQPELSRILEETEKRYYGPESIELFIEGQAFSRVVMIWLLSRQED
jgi:hypothetical protein